MSRSLSSALRPLAPMAFLAPVALYAIGTLASAQTTCPPGVVHDELVGVGAGPFSHYMNPAHDGSAWQAQGDGVQNYGETVVDGFPLVSWDEYFAPGPKPAITACVDTGWGGPGPAECPGGGCTTWSIPAIGGGTWEYERRIVTLPSGASITIFAPCPSTACGPASACPSFDRDAFIQIQITHGPSYDDNPLRDVYIETPATPYQQVPGVFWIRVGEAAYEAMEHGATIVVPEATIGYRPFLWTLAQMVEAAEWMDGPEYENPPLSHRRFISGSSYGSMITIAATLWFPWLIQGGIALASNADLRQQLSWQLTESYLYAALENRQHTPVNLSDGVNGVLWNDMENGYGGGDEGQAGGVGLVDPGVDLMGFSLFAQDLSTPGTLDRNHMAELRVPLIVGRGEEDEGLYTFYGLDAESLPTGTGGKLIVKRIPYMSHIDFGVQNRFNEDERMFTQLLAEADANCTPIPSPSQIQWFDATAPGEARRSRQFDVAAVAHWNDASAPDTALAVSPVVSGGWPELRGYEGLGASHADRGPGSFVARTDLGAPLSIIAGTTRGDVVRLDVTTDGGGVIDGFVEAWRSPVTAPGATTGVIGPSEVLYDSDADRLLALQRHGPLVELDAVTGAQTLRASNDGGADISQDLPLGRWMHGLVRVPGVPTYAATNLHGDLVQFDASGGGTWPVTLDYLEGGVGRAKPLSSSELVYASYHGNLKKIAVANPEHPSPNPATPFVDGDLSPYLGGGPESFQVLDTPILGGVRIVACIADSNLLVLLNEDLELMAEVRPMFANDFRVEPSAAGTLVLTGVWNFDPSGTFPGQQVIARLEVDFGGSLDPLSPASVNIGPANYDVVLSPEVPSAIEEAPPGLQARDDGAVFFNVAWIVTLPSGRLLLVSDLSGTPRRAIVGELRVGMHGIAQRPAPDDDQLIVMGIQDQVIQVDVASGAVSTPPFGIDRNALTHIDLGQIFTCPTALGSISSATTHSPRWGAGIASVRDCADPSQRVDRLYGYYDGGDVYTYEHPVDGTTRTSYVALPWAYIHPDDRKDSWGGVVAVDFERCNPLELSLEPTSDWYATTGGACWASELLIAPMAVNNFRQINDFRGNEAIWADIRGDGDKDLVLATHGGKVVWFENSAAPPAEAPLLPGATLGPEGEEHPAPTGRLELPPFLTAAGADLGVGWEPDLGGTITGLEAVDIAGDDGQELFCTVVLRTDLAHPEHLAQTGSLIALRRTISDGLAVADAIDLGIGPCGVVHTRLLQNAEYPSGNDFVVGTLDGRFHIVNHDLSRGPFNGFELRYTSSMVAPGLGAYGAMVVVDNGDGTARLIVGSSEGLAAFDLDPDS